ncbi:MAG: BF3164 family lipoprotein [Mongoliitalea sp.]
MLTGEKVVLEEILNPRKILFAEGFLIVAESVSSKTESAITIVDSNTLKFISHKGKIGYGPGELGIGYPLMGGLEKGYFWIYDTQQFRFSKFSLQDSSVLAVEEFKALDVPFYATKAAWLSKNSFLVEMVDGWKKYYEVSIEKDTLKSLGDWREMLPLIELPDGIKEEHIAPNVAASIFSGEMKGNPSKTKFVKVGIHTDFIDIIDWENEAVLTLRGPVNESPKFSISESMGYDIAAFDIRTLTNKYLDVYAGEDSFFVLYSGKSFRQISETTNLNRIFEFDYNGTLLNNYRLDYPLYAFTIDEQNRKVFGITADEDPGMVVYELGR